MFLDSFVTKSKSLWGPSTKPLASGTSKRKKKIPVNKASAVTIKRPLCTGRAKLCETEILVSRDACRLGDSINTKWI